MQIQNYIGRFFCIFLMVTNFVSLVLFYGRSRDWTIDPTQWPCPYHRFNGWYKFRIALQLAVSIVWGLTVLFVIAYPVIVSIWILLGMFLNPEFVAPFATATVGLVIHVIYFTNSMIAYLNDVRTGVKDAIREFHAKEVDYLKRQVEVAGEGAGENKDIDEAKNKGLFSVEDFEVLTLGPLIWMMHPPAPSHIPYAQAHIHNCVEILFVNSPVGTYIMLC